MQRREFVALVGAAAAWPLAVSAQQPERVRRIGVLMNLAENQQAQTRITALRQALEQFGWTDHRNVQIEIRWAAGDADRYRNFAAELAALAPDVILATGTPAVEALQRATRTAPIVFLWQLSTQSARAWSRTSRGRAAIPLDFHCTNMVWAENHWNC